MLGYIRRELERLGFDTLVTCREYEYTVGSLRRLGIDPIVIGRYVEGGSIEKVLADVERMKALIDLVSKWDPDVLIAYPNPPASRVAFGLGIKYVALTDSPHAVIPSRLSLPLADYVVYPSAIPEFEISKYVTRGMTKLVPYDGVDEVTWVVRSRPNLKYLESLGLKPCEYVIIRPHEYLATYYKGVRVRIDLEKLISEIYTHGLTPLVLPRYSRHLDLITKLRSLGVDVRVINGGYDGVSLTYYALAVVTGGASMAREAALLGTLGLTYYPHDLYVNTYLIKKGFPLVKVGDTDEVLNYVLSSDRVSECRCKRFDEVLNKVRSNFDDPAKVVIDVLRSV